MTTDRDRRAVDDTVPVRPVAGIERETEGIDDTDRSVHCDTPARSEGTRRDFALPATFPRTCESGLLHNPVPIGSGEPGAPPRKIVCLFCDATRRVRRGDLDGPAFDAIPYPAYVE